MLPFEKFNATFFPPQIYLSVYFYVHSIGPRSGLHALDQDWIKRSGGDVGDHRSNPGKSRHELVAENK